MQRRLSCYRAFLLAVSALALWLVPVGGVLGARTTYPAVIWKQPVRPNSTLCTSPDGTYFGVVAPGGRITCYALNGEIAWRQSFEGVSNLAIGRGGKSLIAFARGDEKHRRVYLLSSSGRLVWRYTPRSAVLCAGVSRDGRKGAFATSGGYIYLCSFTRERPRYRRWHLPGVPGSISFSPDGKQLVVGLGKSGGVGAYSMRGQPVWLAEGDAAKAYSARYCATGDYVLYHGRSAAGDSSHLGILTPDGKSVWSLALGGQESKACISYPGDYVAYGYCRIVEHKTKSARQRFVRLYSLPGRRLWEQGGMLFKPYLISLTPSGHALVQDGPKSLAILDTNGRRIGNLGMPATVRFAVSAPDSGRALVYCGDGWAYLVYAGG